MSLPDAKWFTQRFSKTIDERFFKSMYEGRYEPPFYPRIPTSMRRDYLPGIKEFHWMGWRGYADDLARHGWQFAQKIDQNPLNHGSMCHIAVTHPALQCEGYSHFDLNDFWSEDCHIHQRQIPPRLPLSMEMGKVVRFPEYFIDDPEWLLADAHWRSGDKITEINPERYRGLRQIKVFRDLNPEQAFPVEQRRIILEQASLSEVLEFALAKQETVQREIRKKRMTRSRLVSELHLAAA